MTVGENFADAALLKTESRVENADQFYGLSAECAVKSALVLLPAFSADSRLDESYRKHVNVLWNHINLQSLQRAYPSLVDLLDKNNPFEDWSVDQRYCADGYLSAQTMENHRNAARRLLGAVGLSGVRK
ncbi:hypothetical protein [Methylomagnum ishizawai]|uniref:hypothetical protein n=1 Tax=Methylomagnum ishizawai TaxID=1760988 RepID=UPI001C328CDA|nr:hypothetical protein [Methylomagnum ishizawai]BBL73310.1 hypothetical protein MishRS11D_04080 [Methylomagnum ishizawai]